MLRDFQQDLKRGVYAGWQTGANNVMMVAPTGSGKTVILGNILQELNQPSCAIAHRQELVGQLALALNREHVPHGIIAPRGVVHQIVTLEMDTHGYTCYAARAPVRVAGVDTLVNHDTTDRWLQAVRFVVQDEGHHVLAENKWGRAMALFPHARGLFVTAHAVRADGAGLGRGADGLVDALVVGPSCRDLINRGFLTDYRLICPPCDVDISKVDIGSTGDFSAPQLRAAVHQSSTIVGDVVSTYLKFARGKLGITFAVDVEGATEIANAYTARGVPAAVITAKTPLHIRGALMKQFRARQLLQLVSVDVLGEGVDVPAIEVVSMARHTASFQLYAQQFGRALRIMVPDALNLRWGELTDAERLAHIAASVKPKALVIDHVGNWSRLGLPDVPRDYSLARRERRSRMTTDIPLRTCLNLDCLQVYERFLSRCPHCGTKWEPQGRGSPEMVEGDLIELDAAVLAMLRAEVDRVDNVPRFPQNATPEVIGAIRKNHRGRQDAQATLRPAIDLWAGWQRHLGREDGEIYRRFWHAFGVDVMSACALGASDALDLEHRVREQLWLANVVAA